MSTLLRPASLFFDRPAGLRERSAGGGQSLLGLCGDGGTLSRGIRHTPPCLGGGACGRWVLAAPRDTSHCQCHGACFSPDTELRQESQPEPHARSCWLRPHGWPGRVALTEAGSLCAACWWAGAESSDPGSMASLFLWVLPFGTGSLSCTPQTGFSLFQP